MTPTEEFLDWLHTRHRAGAVALHDGDLAYTVGHERASMRVDGEPCDHFLRVTQVYRREDEGWKVVHRHADDATPRVPGP